MDQGSTDQIATLDFAIRGLQQQVEALQAGQMERVSNCEPWSVRQLASHALNNQLFWAGLVSGQPTVSFEDAMSAAPYDGDLALYAGEVTDLALALWSTEGVLDAIHATPLGEVPGSVVINFATIDAVCHAWDLAVSTGQTLEFDAEMIPTISGVVAATCTDAARDHDLIKAVADTPADATDTERLMALAGRSILR